MINVHLVKPEGHARFRWRGGHCRFGDRCNFAHGDEELRKLPARGESEGSGRGDYVAPRGGYGQGYGTPAGRGAVSSIVSAGCRSCHVLPCVLHLQNRFCKLQHA